MGRASRRKQERDGRVKGLAYSADTIRQLQERASNEILEERGFNVDGLLAVAMNAQWWAAQATKSLASSSGVVPACHQGCAWCCSLAVFAYPHEVFLVAAWLRDKLPADRLEETREHIRAIASQTTGLSRQQRKDLDIPCPLLSDNSCAVYTVRPTACIAWHSLDATPCQQSQDGCPIFAPLLECPNVIGWAAAKVLGLHGAASADTVELVQALRIALDNPDAAQEWLAGQPIFALATLI